MSDKVGFIFCFLALVLGVPCPAAASSRPETPSATVDTALTKSSEKADELPIGGEAAGLAVTIAHGDYAAQRMTLPEPQQDFTTVTGIAIEANQVTLPKPGVKLTVGRSGDLERDLLPTVDVAGNDLSAKEIEAADPDGLDVSFSELLAAANRDIRVYASKVIEWLPKPLLINFGVRKSEPGYSGRYGFDQDRDFVMEGNLMAHFSDQFLLGAEYRQKPNNYSKVSGLATPDHDWWSLVAAYRPSRHATVSGGIFNFSDLLSSSDNTSFGLKVRLDF